MHPLLASMLAESLGWSDHDGGACPCNRDSRVIVRRASGAVEHHPYAGDISWQDVVRWRRPLTSPAAIINQVNRRQRRDRG